MGTSAESTGPGIVATDCFTVETIWLKTLYVLFLHSPQHQAGHGRRGHGHPRLGVVTQQARNLAMDLEQQELSIRFLVRDHDAKFTRSFDEVFCSEGRR